MPWVAAVGAVAGSLITSSAMGDAASTQADATNQANKTQLDQFNQTRQDNMPALDARNASLARMRELLGVGGNSQAQGYGSLGGGINPGDVTQDPGYQFGMQQGQTALNNQLGARGMRNSGAALKAASRFGTDYATTKYDQAFNRQVANRSAQLNPLQSLAGLGQTGASTIAGAGMNAANIISGNQTAQGNALGASQIAQANALSSGINQLGGWYASQNQQPASNSFQNTGGGNAWQTDATNVYG